MLERGPSIDPGTHRGADDTLSGFAFFTRLSWQSWKPSLPLTEREATGQSHGRPWEHQSQQLTLGWITSLPFSFLCWFFSPWRSIKAEEHVVTAARICIFIIYFV